MIALEPLLAIALIVGAVHTGSFRLDTVLNGSVYEASGVPWSGLIMLVVMILSFQAFVQRVPFDISEAETELMEGPLMEYSGPKLALVQVCTNGEARHLQRAVCQDVRALGLAVRFPAGGAVVLGDVLGEGIRRGAAGDAGGGDARALPH